MGFGDCFVGVGSGLGELGEGFSGVSGVSGASDVSGSVGESGAGAGGSDVLGSDFGACGASLVRPWSLGVRSCFGDDGEVSGAVVDGSVPGADGSDRSDRPRRSPLTSRVGSTRLLVPGSVGRPS